MIKKHLELKTYTFNGVEVTVEINYDEQTISLVEKTKEMGMPKFYKKSWVFAKRGLEYMAGWKEVLHAMEYAIESASNELKSYMAEVQKDKEKEACEILDMATKLIKDQEKINFYPKLRKKK